MSRWHIGTSGYQFKEWKGHFYPEDLPERQMLRYYSERLDTVEINYTFYHMPTEKQLTGWAEQTPDRFRFTLKASRRITHRNRLKDSAEEVDYFCRTARILGERLGPILFQLPPNLKKDVPRLAAFCELLPADLRFTVEFRHESWLDDDSLAVLAARGIALTLNDTFLEPGARVPEARLVYARLRQDDYPDSDLARWAAFAREHVAAGRDVFLYLKHEVKGPEFAQRLCQLMTPES